MKHSKLKVDYVEHSMESRKVFIRVVNVCQTFVDKYTQRFVRFGTLTSENVRNVNHCGCSGRSLKISRIYRRRHSFENAKYAWIRYSFLFGNLSTYLIDEIRGMVSTNIYIFVVAYICIPDESLLRQTWLHTPELKSINLHNVM